MKLNRVTRSLNRDPARINLNLQAAPQRLLDPFTRCRQRNGRLGGPMAPRVLYSIGFRHYVGIRGLACDLQPSGPRCTVRNSP